MAGEFTHILLNILWLEREGSVSALVIPAV